MPTAVAAALVGLAMFTDELAGPVFAAMGLFTLICIAVGVVGTAREHPAFPLASTVYITSLFTGRYVSGALSNLLWAVLVALSTLGVVVEAYNYRHGTSHLRLDFE